MKFRIMSDLHLNCVNGNWYPPLLKDDKETCLLLAGDIWEGTKSIIFKEGEKDEVKWLHSVCNHFKYVVMIFGNHSFWGEHLQYLYNKFIRCCEEHDIPDNFYLLQNDHVMIQDVKVIGSTLWTDFNKNDPISIYDASQFMNDYKYIRSGLSYIKVKPEDILLEHIRSIKFIEKELTDWNGKSIVITHHAPSFKSGSKIWSDGHEYYCSDLSELILDYKPNFWIHGHVHEDFDYMIGDTRIICNPLGYPGESGSKYFNPYFSIKI